MSSTAGAMQLVAHGFSDAVLPSSQLALPATTELPSPSTSSVPGSSLQQRPHERAGPLQVNRISSSAGFSRTHWATPDDTRNSPTISQTTISPNFLPGYPLSGKQAPSEHISTSSKGSTSRSESTRSESTYSNTIVLSSPDTSDDELVVKSASSSTHCKKLHSEGKGKGKAREQSPESKPRPGIRRRSSGPSPNPAKKPRLELAITRIPADAPEGENSGVLSTEERMRIALPLPANLDLTSFENPWPDRDLSFTREQIGGMRVQALGYNKEVDANVLCIKDGMNVAPMRAGECGLFFSVKEKIDELGKWEGDFPVFVSGSGTNDWQYRGQYDVVHKGFTAPGSLKGMDVNRKIELRKVLEAHQDPKKKKDWWKKLREDWRIGSTTSQGALDEFGSVDTEAGMRYIVLKCRGFNEGFYDVWNRRRPKPKSGKSCAVARSAGREGPKQDLQEEDSDSDVEIISRLMFPEAEREDQQEPSGQSPVAIEVRRSGRKSGPSLSRYSPNP